MFVVRCLAAVVDESAGRVGVKFLASERSNKPGLKPGLLSLEDELEIGSLKIGLRKPGTAIRRRK